jgi:hypothetical protein
LLRAVIEFAEFAAKDAGVIHDLINWGDFHHFQKVILRRWVFLTTNNQNILEALVIFGTV